jgi:hypothetical protein
MDSAKLNDWMQVFGIFALVGSLIFVGLQMRQDRTIALVESLASRSEVIADLADMIGNNEDLWIRALNGDELSNVDEATFHAMTEAIEAYFVSIWRRSQGLGGEASMNSATGDYAYALYTHSGLRRAWKNQLEYWSARDSALGVESSGRRFREQVSAYLAQLDNEAPPIPAKKRYVFW